MNPNSRTEKERKRKRERLAITISLFLILLFSAFGYFILERYVPANPINTTILFGILSIDILLVLYLLFLILRYLVKAIFEERQHLLGAKLRTKLVIAFVSLSLLPTLLLFWVSYQFLKTSVAYWFDVKVERALENALTVGKTYYEDQIAGLQIKGEEIARLVSRRCMTGGYVLDQACVEQIISPASLLVGIPEIRHGTPLHCVEILGPKGDVLFSKTWLPLLPPLPGPSEDIISSVLADGKISTLNDELEGSVLLRVLLPMASETGVRHILVAGTLLPQDIARLLDEIRTGYEDYNLLFLSQNPIKGVILLTLFLITLLIIFVSIWFGYRIADGITKPVQALAEATRRIAQGDLDVRLEIPGKDELSSLLRAFNTMTLDLKEARQRAENAARELQKSNAEIESRRRYMEIILDNVAAGVISVDRLGIITTMNPSAESILGKPASSFIGRSYVDVMSPEQLEEFEVIRHELLVSKTGTVQKSIRLQSNNRILSLLCNFSQLRDREGRSLGTVIVFEDLTELERIQRIAAWREVARRIAHEIKNPLTPIQLSAQRLRKKYLPMVDSEARDVFDRSTATIIEQVEDLKRLANEFSNFARMPAPRFVPTDLEKILKDLTVIYREGHPEVEFTLDMVDTLPEILVDPDQIKRAVINLLENAIAAMPDGGSVRIQVFGNTDAKEVSISIADTGTGIPPEDRKRLFEPYFSRKRGGTGLGLAIVHSIVTDHGGRIEVEDNTPRGTRFTLYLPNLPA
ncbi:MAG: HAMP domain-containing protein [Deltaproteobacteria bacterium]